jgi:hypothetical protein
VCVCGVLRWRLGALGSGLGALGSGLGALGSGLGALAPNWHDWARFSLGAG